MKARLSVYRAQAPLVVPYKLSFGTVCAFDTLYVRLESGDRNGFGEVTPLPGYSAETVDAAIEGLARAGGRLAGGGEFTAVALDLWRAAPFAGSGLVSALETLREGLGIFEEPLSGPVPLSAHCPGKDATEAAVRAEDLMRAGYETLKLKVGRDTGADLERVKAVARAVDGKCSLRLDANQGLDFDSALRLCSELEGVAGVRLLEQPFAPDDWDSVERLAARTSLPLMQDESVWDEKDVQRTADAGASWIKFKLCKHPGLAACLGLIDKARGLGLSVVFGNGVQTALGNRLENVVFRRAGLTEASEANGFLKPSISPIPHRIRVESGKVFDNGLERVQDAVSRLERVLDFEIPESAIGLQQ